MSIASLSSLIVMKTESIFPPVQINVVKLQLATDKFDPEFIERRRQGLEVSQNQVFIYSKKKMMLKKNCTKVPSNQTIVEPHRSHLAYRLLSSRLHSTHGTLEKLTIFQLETFA